MKHEKTKLWKLLNSKNIPPKESEAVRGNERGGVSEALAEVVMVFFILRLFPPTCTSDFPSKDVQAGIQSRECRL